MCVLAWLYVKCVRRDRERERERERKRARKRVREREREREKERKRERERERERGRGRERDRGSARDRGTPEMYVLQGGQEAQRCGDAADAVRAEIGLAARTRRSALKVMRIGEGVERQIERAAGGA
jgi:hypothetical protein